MSHITNLHSTDLDFICGTEMGGVFMGEEYLCDFAIGSDETGNLVFSDSAIADFLSGGCA